MIRVGKSRESLIRTGFRAIGARSRRTARLQPVLVATATGTARLLPTAGVGHHRIVVAPQAIKAAVRLLAEPIAQATATAQTG
ncbi:MAG: hypothetical protein ABL908_01650 [Hyphomicrobium sp.]